MPPARSFAQKVRRALTGECRCAPGTRLLVGCSGGPDSTALLLALAALREDLGLSLHAVYVHHGLRAEAEEEGAEVLRRAAVLAVPARMVRVQVPRGASRMAHARRVRYQALAAVAARENAQAVAVGHTRGDQAETVLLRLLGGAGLRGLGGMAPRRRLSGTEVDLVRPLLGLDRAEVEAFLRESGPFGPPAEDPTNRDPRYLRTRLRHEILPLLRRERPDLDRHLYDLAAQLRQDAEYLEQAAAQELERLAPDLGRQAEPVLPARELRALAPALFARVLGRLLGPLSRRHLVQLRRLCASERGSRSIDLPGGRRAERSYGELRLGPTSPAPVAAAVPIPGPGRYRLFDTEIEVELREQGVPGPPGPDEVCFDARQVAPPLCLRTTRPGDRMAIRGGHKKLSDLFIDAKVPRSRRARMPLLCAGAEVLWAIGLRVSARACSYVQVPCLVVRLLSARV